ncbi:MAG: GHKL domain-containing protein [Candidatus Aminicenantes bacterium]|nr:GHKL domain-containing protein [Candidatus Aminicenantes bacterium]NIM78771.1 GHKL domain-containing protein [Candidatus Aminicenantes bacterium]NIN18026.1 GHKL domain-containing protein [Candidatus Aminicenantes bacterium]NIN41926.1 GHKL domain-containing protein [Candidatus Aminicenantes bacterium]NIN84681.1 GHKL domain-containing protein [Candidatus Aminicenantes bacterium]
MIKRKKKLPLLLMAVVIGAGLIIGIVGIYLVSQQKNARLLNVKKEFTNRLLHIGTRVEARTRELVEAVFQQVERKEINVDNPEALIDSTKTIVLSNPIVKYPFFINSRKQFIFPISRKTGLPVLKSQLLEPKIIHKQAKEFYTEGYNLEYRKRNFIDAVKAYQKSLEAGDKAKADIKPYIYHAIARCYFKLNQFPQAAHYYRRLLDRYPEVLKKGNLFYLTVLRQLASSFKQMDSMESALQFYLRLYEEVLKYDVPGKSNPYAFYRNEALDYLNRHIRAGEQQPKTETDGMTRSRVEAVERLRETSELDISLRWSYFEVDAIEGAGRPGETDSDDSRFLRLRELYESNDEKTRFYKALKNSPQWSLSWSRLTPGSSQVHIEQLNSRGSGSNPPFYFAFKPIKLHSRQGIIYFGFMFSVDFIRTRVIRSIAREYLGDSSIVIDISEPAEPGKTSLVSVPFHGLFSGKTLTLYSDREDYFETIVRRDIHLYYGLLLALILTLAMGIFLIFKYLSREAELVKLKSDFLDSVSHTLKTPLTRISLLAENMTQGWVTDESRKKEFFHTIISETGRMSEMIDNMLNFSRIEAGKQHYEMEKTYLPEVVGSVIDFYSAYIKNHGFQLTVDMDDNVPALFLDPKAVKLIVGNLLQNALKYSLKDKTIKIRVYKAKEDVVFEIEDRGIGIPHKEIPHIFKKFSRVPDDTIKSIEGSGLGLFLVRHAVEAHNGRIDVTSTEGKGTTFRIYFPVNVVKLATKAQRHKERVSS